MIVAEYIGGGIKGFNSDARLYKLSKPIEYKKYTISTDSLRVLETDHIVISSVSNGWVHETKAFPADEHGTILDWGALACGRYDDYDGVLHEALTASLEDKQ